VVPCIAASFGRNIYYSFNYGSVHVIVFSTEHDFLQGSEQWTFIQNDLQRVDRTVTPWVILTGHRPMYTSDSGAGIGPQSPDYTPYPDPNPSKSKDGFERLRPSTSKVHGAASGADQAQDTKGARASMVLNDETPAGAAAEAGFERIKLEYTGMWGCGCVWVCVCVCVFSCFC